IHSSNDHLRRKPSCHYNMCLHEFSVLSSCTHCCRASMLATHPWSAPLHLPGAQQIDQELCSQVFPRGAPRERQSG
ncbi:hypothetical protein PMAYCL1PPCAC_14445, partial [Pristionchus mayeri]